MTVLKKLVTGLTPLMLDTHTLRIELGMCAAAGPAPDTYIENNADTELDITRVGPWGLDRALWGGNVWAYLWAVGDSTGANPGACMLSPASGSGVSFIIPEGYDRVRFLGYAVKIIGSSQGMLKQLVTSWPFPCRAVYQDVGTYHEKVVSTNGAWSTVSLSDLVPDNARIASLSLTSEAISGSGGSVWVRTPGNGDGGPAIVTPQTVPRDVALSSAEGLEVKTAAAARLRMRVFGWEVLSTY